MISFLSNPLISFFGTCLTTIGVFLAVYFYYSSKKERKLMYSVHPKRTIIFKSGQVSSLRVFHNNVELTGDISSIRMVIWNQGNKSIRRENILEDIKIITRPQVPIIEVKTLKLEREVSDFKIDTSQLGEGIIPISWKILEFGDGAILQLSYLGAPEFFLLVVGVIEEQQEIVDMNYMRKPKPSGLLYSLIHTSMILFLFVFIVTDALTARLLPRGLLPLVGVAFGSLLSLLVYRAIRIKHVAKILMEF